MNEDASPRAGPSAVLRAPFQAPAVDRSPTAPARADADTPGVEANWTVPWHLIGPQSKGGIMPWYAGPV
ncbi:hypothetical protein PV721_34235 [Streptomyces sp. MB09-01]|uniref:hypothetical protein n=1 Tax=Streptomyces sp. MB09-01 TaxID=3028666 RepID=UPI0029B9A9D2|nr:hypothetical protein [Streptomyces sp. MB09-01]MDX3539297.1 hypothetical protein [Streptomyces sp. MB09-01]